MRHLIEVLLEQQICHVGGMDGIVVVGGARQHRLDTERLGVLTKGPVVAREARATKAEAWLQIFGSDARVAANLCAR